MTHVTCRLTAKNRDHPRNSTLGNRVWATFTLFTPYVCRRVCGRAAVAEGGRRGQAHGVSVRRQPDQGRVVHGGHQHDPQHGRRAQPLRRRREGRDHRENAGHGAQRGSVPGLRCPAVA